MVVTSGKKKLALVYGNLPTVEEIDQFQLVAPEYDVTVIGSESVCGYLTQTCSFQGLPCIALPDYDENPSYIPGLEKALAGFDVVVVKERLGMYAFQVVKAKWRHRFRLVVWVDNATPFPGQDIVHMRTIRSEVASAADALIVQSDAVFEALRLEGIPEKKIIRFPAWTSVKGKRSGKDRAAALTQLGLHDTDFVIGHIGQIEWEESLFDLAHAMKHMASIDKALSDRLKIVFCGIGSFATDLRDRMVSLGLDRQVVYVAPSREAFETFFSAIDALYFVPTPSRDRLEGEPYRLVSAVQAGVPVMAPRTPIVEEIVGKHRLDFCKGSFVSLANAIEKAATAPALRKDIAQKSKNAFNLSHEQVADSMLKELQKVFGETPIVNPNALDHQVVEAESLVFAKQYLAAIDLIESLFKISDMPIHHRANLLRLVGDSFTKLGDGEAGKNAYIKSIELDPYAARAYIGLGTVALTKKSYETAVPQFQKAVSLAPDDEMASLGLGLAFQGLGELNEASRWAVKALQLSPENTAGIFTLVQISHDRGRYDEAITAVESYLKIHPTDLNMIYTLAGIKHKVGNSKEAESLVARILAADPYNERALALRRQISQDASGKAETFHG
jgi:tetratricopeptide (TPR) repeat protein